MKSAAVALQCSGAGAPEVEQHFYQISFRVEEVFWKFSETFVYYCGFGSDVFRA